MRADERLTREKRLFLATLRENGGYVTKACKAVGRSRTTLGNWRDADPEFAAAWEAVQELNVEDMEGEVRRRAMGYEEELVYQGHKTGETVTKWSDTLLMFMLKALRPQTYREGPGVGKGAASQLSDKELDEAIGRLIAKRTAKGQSAVEAVEPSEAVN